MSTENAAMFGAMLGRKGLTPEQAAEVMHQAGQVLDDAVQAVENGADVDSIRFGLIPGQS